MATQPQVQIPGTNQGTDNSQQIDPTALNLSRAIRATETTPDGNYTAVGDNGQSHGAYQFNGDNFQTWAKQYGLDPSDLSPTNQDHVAYMRVKDLLDQGNAPSEVAARWNGCVLKDGKYCPINPDYVAKVQANYNKLLNPNSGFNPTPYSNPTNGVDYSNLKATTPTTIPQQQGLGQELVGETNKAGQAIQNTMSGKINPVSGVIQTVGAGAGGFNDVVTAGLELIPGVKQLEGLLGQGIGKLAQTPAGQSVAKSIQSFSQAHPELSDDIGAGFNIVTAIPIFKGLGMAKDLAMDAAAQGLRSVAEKGAISDLTEVLTRTGAGRDALESVPTGLKTLVDKNALPDLVTEGGVTRYNTVNARQIMGKAISDVDKNELSPLLKGVTTTFPMDDVKSIANDIAVKNLSDPEAVNKILDRVVTREGDNLTLEQLNQVKRDISQKISDAAFGDPDLSNLRIARMALQQGIEIGGETAGVPNIGVINQKMAALIKAQDMLSNIDGKAIKKGLWHKVIGGISTGIGAGVGGAFGNPLAGAGAGYAASGLAEKALGGLTPREISYNLLKRSAFR